MKKYYARELDNEYFDYEAYLDEDTLSYSGIAICGNRDYCDMNADLVEDIEKNVDNCIYDLETISDDFNDEQITEDELKEQQYDTYSYYFKKKDNTKLTSEELLDLIDCVLDFYDDKEKNTLKILKILTGKEYKCGQIQGCCQGDWNNIYYPEETSRDFICFIQAVYFGTGTEYQITEKMFEEAPDFDEEDVYCDYTHFFRDEDVKNWIAKNNNCSPEEVALLKIKNTRHVIQHDYEEI